MISAHLPRNWLSSLLPSEYLSCTHLTPNILFVDDEPFFLEFIRRRFQALPFQIATAESGSQALDLYQTIPLDAAVIDFRMPRMNGLELLETIRRIDRTLPVIMLSAGLDESVSLQASELGCHEFFPKPCPVPQLSRRLISLIHPGAESLLAPVLSEKRFEIKAA